MFESVSFSRRSPLTQPVNEWLARVFGLEFSLFFTRSGYHWLEARRVPAYELRFGTEATVWLYGAIF